MQCVVCIHIYRYVVYVDAWVCVFGVWCVMCGRCVHIGGGCGMCHVYTYMTCAVRVC